jgi:hypothetical protein
VSKQAGGPVVGGGARLRMSVAELKAADEKPAQLWAHGTVLPVLWRHRWRVDDHCVKDHTRRIGPLDQAERGASGRQWRLSAMRCPALRISTR